MRRRKKRRTGSSEENVNPMNYISNLSDVMLVLAIGIMIALISAWNVDGWQTEEEETTAEVTEETDANQIELSSEDMEEADEEKDSEEMEKLGSVYYDSDTGMYYIIQD